MKRDRECGPYCPVAKGASNWCWGVGLSALLLLSSCASQQDLVDLQRQLQTVRGEVAAVRRQVVEVKMAAEERSARSDKEEAEAVSRLKEDMTRILATVEAQQKAVESISSMVATGLKKRDEKAEERMQALERRVGDWERAGAERQGGIGARLGEMEAELRIVGGKLEELDNLLVEQGSRLDEVGRRCGGAEGRLEATERELKSLRGLNQSQGEKLGRLEGQIAGLMKSWEEWKEKADRALLGAAETQRRVESLEAEVRAWMGSGGKAAPMAQAPVLDEAGEKAKAVPSVGGKEGTVAPESAASSAAAPSGEETYRAAYMDYSRGDYDLAISGFREYLAKYPRGSLAPNSRYWLGECLYSQKKFKEAIAEFEAVMSEYPKSAKAAGALLKKGYCLEAIGEFGKAKLILQEVVGRYPNTPEASLAEGRLKKMKE